MARMVKDAALQTRETRLKLTLGRRWWRSIHVGLAIGYRRGRKKGSGSWLARTHIGDDEYDLKSIGTADDHSPADGVEVLTFEQAQAKVIAHAENLKRTSGTLPQFLTVDVAIGRYVEHVIAAKGKTAGADAEARLRVHVPPGLRSRLVDDLGFQELLTWRNALVNRDDRPVSRATANRIRANFQAALNLAFKDEKAGIRSDKAWRTLEPFKEANTARKDHFEASDVQKLANEARKFDPAFADLIAAGFLTGARYGELCACDVRHFDRKSNVLSLPAGKTGARSVSLTNGAIEFFQRISKDRPRDAPLLPMLNGERWRKSVQTCRMKRALRGAGLPASASFYSLRHSYVSRMLESGVSTYLIAVNTGTSEKMIRSNYAKLLAKHTATMLERADGAFSLTL